MQINRKCIKNSKQTVLVKGNTIQLGYMDQLTCKRPSRNLPGYGKSRKTRDKRKQTQFGIKKFVYRQGRKKNDKKYENIIELWHENIIYSESPAHP